jgi:hypothetical protein
MNIPQPLLSHFFGTIICAEDETQLLCKGSICNCLKHEFPAQAVFIEIHRWVIVLYFPVI